MACHAGLLYVSSWANFAPASGGIVMLSYVQQGGGRDRMYTSSGMRCLVGAENLIRRLHAASSYS